MVPDANLTKPDIWVNKVNFSLHFLLPQESIKSLKELFSTRQWDTVLKCTFSRHRSSSCCRPSNSCPLWPCPSSSQDSAEEAFRTSRMWTLGQEVKQSRHYRTMGNSCGDVETAFVSLKSERDREMREPSPPAVITSPFCSLCKTQGNKWGHAELASNVWRRTWKPPRDSSFLISPPVFPYRN